MSLCSVASSRLFSLNPLLFAGLLGLTQMSFAATASPLCPTISRQQPLTLSQAISYALCQNPDSQQQWLQIANQQAALDLSKASNYPTLSLQGSVNSSYSQSQSQDSLGVQARLSYLLFDFGQRQAQQAQANFLLQQAQWHKDSTLAELSYQVTAAYLSVLKAQGQIQASQKSLSASQKSLASSEARFKVGTGTPLEVLQAKSALAQARLNLVKAHSEYANQQSQLALLLGIMPTELGELVAVNLSVLNSDINENELQQWLIQAAQQRPEVKAAQANIQAAEQAIIAAKTANKPSVSLSAATGWQQSDGNESNSRSVGLSVDIPFDIGGGTRARIRQSEIQKAQQQLSLENNKQQIYQQVWQAFYQLQAALETVSASQEGLASSDSAAHMALARYEVGLSTILDVLNAQSQAASTQQQLLAAQFDALAARNRLSYALGQQLALP